MVNRLRFGASMGTTPKGFGGSNPTLLFIGVAARLMGSAFLSNCPKALTESGLNWLQRDYRIAQGLAADCAVKPLAFEQTDRGPALIYADEGARPLEELAAKAPLDIETVLTIGAEHCRGCCRSAQGAARSLQPEPDHDLAE